MEQKGKAGSPTSEEVVSEQDETEKRQNQKEIDSGDGSSEDNGNTSTSTEDELDSTDDPSTNQNQTQNQNAPPTLTASDITPPAFMQESASTITLPYNVADGFTATSCTVSGLQGVNVHAPCSCVAGSCSVGVTGNIGIAGPASFSYTVSDASTTSASASASLSILPDRIDDDFSNTGFGPASFDNAEWTTAINLLSWTEDERELQYDQGGGSIIESDFNASGLAGYWRLNGNIGTNAPTGVDQILDYSGNGNHGQLYDLGAGSQPTFIAGVLNEGIDLDGNDDRISIDNDPSLEPGNGSYSIVAWVKPDNVNSEGNIFYGGHSSGQYFYLGFGNATGTGAGKRLHGALSQSITNEIILRTEVDVIDGNWHQYSFVADKDSDTIYLYLDGKRLATDYLANAGSWPTLTVDQGYGIGDENTNSIYDVAGEFDEVMVFTRALSADEMHTLYLRQSQSIGGGEPGEVLSRVFDSGQSSADWNSLAWTPAAPYGKEMLPEVGAESAYSAGNAEASLYVDLVGYWRVNGNAGENVSTAPDAIIDYSGNGNHGQAQDGGSPMTYADGMLNQGIDFDGTSDLIFIANDPSLNTNLANNELTVAAWVKIDSCSNNGRKIVERKLDGANQFRLHCYSDERAEMSIFSNVDSRSAKSTSMITDGQWKFLVGSLDGNGTYIYVNGLLEASSLIPMAIANNFGDLRIGGSFDGGDRYADGIIDEIAIWNRRLSDAEILRLYRRGAQRLQFQVSACAQANCSDAVFVGPDGTANTFFDEGLNTGIGQPSLDISPPLQGRYFQYKTILKSADGIESPKFERVEVGFDGQP